MTFHVPEKFRIRSGPVASDNSYGNNGAFLVRSLKLGVVLTVIASDGEGWEHVSVSTPTRCPTWEEMCYIKSLFWGEEEETVMQLHPPNSQSINNHAYCLHLWKPTGAEAVIPLPPAHMVGYKSLRVLYDGKRRT
jgi:hypothetical protein